MPSRKRAKGRERKLKQQAREPVEQSVSQPSPSPNGGNINKTEQIIRMIEQVENLWCHHGGYKIPRGHPVKDFIDSFIETVTSENCSASTISEFMRIKFEEHHDVLQDFAMKKLVIDTLVSIGTDFIIEEFIEHARHTCRVIIYLQHYCEAPFDSVFFEATGDITYILHAEQRDVIHFYRKRIPCSCLDELYSEIKKIQVRGAGCYHCKQIIKSKDLKTCNRCKCAYYCSKECQISDWPSHKEDCKHMCSIPKILEKAVIERMNEEAL